MNYCIFRVILCVSWPKKYQSGVRKSKIRGYPCDPWLKCRRHSFAQQILSWPFVCFRGKKKPGVAGFNKFIGGNL